MEFMPDIPYEEKTVVYHRRYSETSFYQQKYGKKPTTMKTWKTEIKIYNQLIKNSQKNFKIHQIY
jgi:hypothetical protein